MGFLAKQKPETQHKYCCFKNKVGRGGSVERKEKQNKPFCNLANISALLLFMSDIASGKQSGKKYQKLISH